MKAFLTEIFLKRLCWMHYLSIFFVHIWNDFLSELLISSFDKMPKLYELHNPSHSSLCCLEILSIQYISQDYLCHLAHQAANSCSTMECQNSKPNTHACKALYICCFRIRNGKLLKRVCLQILYCLFIFNIFWQLKNFRQFWKL